jgi:uncharacterized damage-inducible protein DinB
MSKKRIIPKPMPGEYPEYADMYMKWLPEDGRILQHLKAQVEKTKEFVYHISNKQWEYIYSPGKWSIKEVLLHIIDDERIYSYRALRIGRGDQTPLPGFEQNDYVPFSRADDRSVGSILKEYTAVRKATLSLFRNFSDEDLMRRGTANNHSVTVRALLYHMAGHELHHLHVIEEKYLQESVFG